MTDLNIAAEYIENLVTSRGGTQKDIEAVYEILVLFREVED